jgi:hypothetical protein
MLAGFPIHNRQLTYTDRLQSKAGVISDALQRHLFTSHCAFGSAWQGAAVQQQLVYNVLLCLLTKQCWPQCEQLTLCCIDTWLVCVMCILCASSVSAEAWWQGAASLQHG